jgi:hypothetical protein
VPKKGYKKAGVKATPAGKRKLRNGVAAGIRDDPFGAGALTAVPATGKLAVAEVVPLHQRTTADKTTLALRNRLARRFETGWRADIPKMPGREPHAIRDGTGTNAALLFARESLDENINHFLNQWVMSKFATSAS